MGRRRAAIGGYPLPRHYITHVRSKSVLSSLIPVARSRSAAFLKFSCNRSFICILPCLKTVYQAPLIIKLFKYKIISIIFYYHFFFLLQLTILISVVLIVLIIIERLIERFLTLLLFS